MNAIGIVAEYNPFHDGHIYQIESSVRQSLADVVVVAMSGNFVQRGEPAICDKWKRAEIALMSGADLIVEIPTYFCLSDARTYAGAGMTLFKKLGGISMVSFGSESGDIEAIKEAGAFLNEKYSIIEQEIKKLTVKGFSYPRARQEILQRLGAGPKVLKVISAPNDTLGMEYIRNWDKKSSICIKRNKTSATEIRRKLYDGDYQLGMLPSITEDILFREHSHEDFPKLLKERDERTFELLRFIILRENAFHLEEMPQAGEGLAFRLKKAALKAKNLGELIELSKSKRYTYTRISRLVYQILLDITRVENAEPEYIRVLGFTNNGRKFLSEVKKKETNRLPIITNINKYKDKENLELDIRATEIYNMINGFDLEQFHELRRNPVCSSNSTYLPDHLGCS